MCIQPEDPEISLEVINGETTLTIAGRQAMQQWEYELMRRSAEIMCEGTIADTQSKNYLEAGLGLGISARHIGSHASTAQHTVIEKYAKVIQLYTQNFPVLPHRVKLIQDDFFRFIETAPSNYYDGIFFDPALPRPLWDQEDFWQQVTAHMKRILKPAGRLMPFFSTTPEIRKQYRSHFSKVYVERHPFKAYGSTNYTHGLEGDAYIQCFIKDA